MRKLLSAMCTLSIMICLAKNRIDSYDETVFSWSGTFAKVAQTIGQRHFKLPEDGSECWVEAINSYVNCLDPHSGFLGPKAYKQIMQSTSGSFGGIGIVIDNTRQPKDPYLTVIDVIPDGPADQAGLQALDKIVEIDHKLLAGMTTEEATAQLRGKPSSTVEVKVLREKYPDMIVTTITRDIIKEQSSTAFYLPDQQIYYLSLSTFTQAAINQISSLLSRSQEQPYKGLILDLRNNSGGLLTAAIDIAGLFLPHKSLVVETKARDAITTQTYKTTRKPIFNNTMPLFILINNYTASAGEILAGCLQTHSIDQQSKNKQQLMVFLVGTRTFGKGSVQEIIPLDNNSALKLTTALYYLPGDVSIQGVGIEPDFVIEKTLPQTEPMKWFTKSHGRECAMINYISTEKSQQYVDEIKKDEHEKNSQPKNKKWSERMQHALKDDNQLKHAVMMINLLEVAKTLCPQKVQTRQSAFNFLKQVTLDSITLQEAACTK